MSAVTSHSWALVTGMVNVVLVHATPIPGANPGDPIHDGKPGDVLNLEANVANILVGSGMAKYSSPWGPSSTTGKMFKTGESKPVSAPAAAPAAETPAKA
jgi:hypothetical protein